MTITDRILALVRRYPIATGALVAALLIVGGWQVYQAAVRPQVAAPPAPAPSGTPPQVAPPPAQGPANQGAAPRPPGSAPSQEAPAAPGAGTEGGRSNPFVPLISPGGGTGQPLPPVPPLAPGAPGVEGAQPAVQYRLAGILIGAQALAIVEDGKNSYVVGPGDFFGSGAEVVAIDARRAAVRIKVNGIVTTLTLKAAAPPGASSPPAPLSPAVPPPSAPPPVAPPPAGR